MNIIKVVLLSLAVISVNAYAKAKLAILDFYLTTSHTYGIEAEHKRVAAVKPFLEESFKTLYGDLVITVPTDSERQKSADKGLGYIASHPDVAANLGRAFGADYVIVGRVLKASGLFSYFIVKVVDVKSQQIIADLRVEAKGKAMEATKRSTRNLARIIIEQGGIILPSADT